MNRFRHVFSGALRTASLLALLLALGVVLNGLLMGYAVFRMANTDVDSRIGEYADTLSNERPGADYALTKEQERQLEKQGRFLMLLDANGRVVFSYRKPDEIPNAYTHADVARFTRWHLEDYPVHVRIMEEGLLILGFPKGSVWKYMLETPMPTMLFWPVWGVVVLLSNFLLILVLSVGTTSRAYGKRDAARTEWIAAVSHDVRTPLSAVLGYASSLENDSTLTTLQREQASVIRRMGEELRLLIENLNLTNRLEHSMEPLSSEWISLASVVRETVVSCLNDDALTPFPIEADIAPAATEYRLYGDRMLLVRMLKNLIGNSINHNPRGCAIGVGLHAKGRKLILVVSDNGVGFSAEQLQKLDGRKALPTSGHGLGLSIVKQIVSAHHGRIFFANGADGGSLCTICFGGVRVKKAPSIAGKNAPAMQEDSFLNGASKPSEQEP